VNEHTGWLLDVYTDRRDGVVLWILGDDGRRRRFHFSFSCTFHAAGPPSRLRSLWKVLREHPGQPRLSRTRRRDLFAGPLDTLAIQADNPALQTDLFQEAQARFPELDFYDADIPIALRLSAATGLFPLARCRATAGDEDRLLAIEVLDSPWELEPAPPPLRTLRIEPDRDPGFAPPSSLFVDNGRSRKRIDLEPTPILLLRLQAALRRDDPDLIITCWGDTWIIPTLLDACRAAGITYFNLNRDPQRQVDQRPASSFFTYGRVVYRGRQARLFGRWHIDEKNAVMLGDYGLVGVLEQARVTGLPVQEVARKSPGAGITAMQMVAALREGVLVPVQKQQAESFKSARSLITADRGGLVYQPLVGLHRQVAEIDFVSMYPSIMVHFNISPETVGAGGDDTRLVPELGIRVDQSRQGLVPGVLKPLLAKRLALKQRLRSLERYDCRYGPLKARSNALKWLLVVSFGYLGYKNARFGRIEAHEAVTAYGREALLRAKEAVEDAGLVVLHMYVDGLWVKRPGDRPVGDVQPLLEEIMARTGLPIALEGTYRWLAFLPSKLDRRVPVPNRYFGLFEDGRFKLRGIEARRHDTAPFVAQAQLEMLKWLARLPEGRPLSGALAGLAALIRRYLAELRAGRIGIEQLLISQTLSRELADYRMPSPAARAAGQLAAAGKELRPGQRVRFIYTRGDPDVWAWDAPEKPGPECVDVNRYAELLVRAARTVIQPLGLDERIFGEWVLYDSFQRSFGF